MKILLLDNYDSFTFNLLHYLEQHDNVSVDIYRNDEIELNEIDIYDAIVLSPGPGLPNDAGILIPLINKYASTKKILGVCLGLQAIVMAFGGSLKNLHHVQHGITRKTFVLEPNEILYKNIPNQIMCGRYHSWVADENLLPLCFKVTAVDENKNIMSLRHKQFNLCAVQFHPESILTEYGLQMISNWIEAV